MPNRRALLYLHELELLLDCYRRLPKAAPNIMSLKLHSADKRIIKISLMVICLIAIAVAVEVQLESRASSSVAAQPLIIPPDHPRSLIDFALRDQTDSEITRQSLKGKIVVASFLFTSCSVVCPYVTDQMAQIQHQTAKDADVRLISLTVDPDDDTVPVLAKFAKKAGANPNRWSFLTGSDSSMQNLIATSFLPRATDTNFSFMPGNYAHSECIVLVDTNGQILNYFDGLNLDAAHAVLQEIQKLRKSHP